MVESDITCNAQAIEQDLDWLAEVVATRLNLFLGNETKYKEIYEILPPEISNNHLHYHDFIKTFSFEERLIFVLALVIHFRPQLLDALLLNSERTGKPFTEFGGNTGHNHRGFIPTYETAFFILAGNNLVKRITVSALFNHNHFFFQKEIFHKEETEKRESRFSCALTIEPRILDMITTGSPQLPFYSSDFPAVKLETNRNWHDKVFDYKTNIQLEEVRNWIEHAENLRNEWHLQSIVSPGYRCLFYGPPGTGKTFTANLLGKETGKNVYRIDLSGLVSKYVGETIKNLERIFKQADSSILFFDEADALFGKRTQVKDSNDRFANQEVAYLLQKIEVFDGTVILASNLKENLDDAFMRRFNTVVYFPIPQERERQKIWRNSFPKIKPQEENVLDILGYKYELSGGNITNAAHFASMLAYTRIRKLQKDLAEGKKLSAQEKETMEKEINNPIIKTDEIMQAIKREYSKENKSFPRDTLAYAKAI